MLKKKKPEALWHKSASASPECLPQPLPFHPPCPFQVPIHTEEGVGGWGWGCSRVCLSHTPHSGDRPIILNNACFPAAPSRIGNGDKVP